MALICELHFLGILEIALSQAWSEFKRAVWNKKRNRVSEYVCCFEYRPCRWQTKSKYRRLVNLLLFNCYSTLLIHLYPTSLNVPSTSSGLLLNCSSSISYYLFLRKSVYFRSISNTLFSYFGLITSTILFYLRARCLSFSSSIISSLRSEFSKLYP